MRDCISIQHGTKVPTAGLTQLPKTKIAAKEVQAFSLQATSTLYPTIRPQSRVQETNRNSELG